MKKTILSLLCFTILSLSCFSAQAALLGDLQGDIANVGAGGGLDVAIQDQHSPVLIVPMNKVNNTTTSTVVTAVDDTTVTVAATTGFVAGAFVTVTSITDNRYYTARQVGAVAGLVVTLDTPLDFAYPIGSQVTAGTTDLSVDGSSTTQVFSLRAADPGVPVEIDVTRIILTCTDATAADFTKFCGGAVLTKGIVIRRNDGLVNNIFNAKSNVELANIMYDFTVWQSTNPVQGIDGFVGRLTFGGQNKIGVVIRIGAGEDLEVLIQDDLTGLTTFEIMVEGHVVVPD